MNSRQFPIFERKIRGNPLVYLDNAATTQKPRVVIEAMSEYYSRHNANVHRGVHTLAQEATRLFELTRDKVQKFINAKSREEIVFTRGATESLNLVAATWGEENIGPGDEIVLTEMEHHSNLVPWQRLVKKKRAKLRFISIDENGRLDSRSISRLIRRGVKLVSVMHASNVLGTINHVRAIARRAHAVGAKMVVDGAQAGAHLPIDVQKLNCDFYVLAGHKMYGPTGVGVLYGKKDLLENMPPYESGGHMIRTVSLMNATWNDPPGKFEAGTPSVAEVVGLGAAVDFINKSGEKKLYRHEEQLLKYALQKLLKIDGLTLYGPKEGTDRLGVFSFTVAGVPPHDLATILDDRGIAVRTGHHCAMPLHSKLGAESTARASLAGYNTKKDIDELVRGIREAINIFAGTR